MRNFSKIVEKGIQFTKNNNTTTALAPDFSVSETNNRNYSKKQPNEEWGDANGLSESPNMKKFETLAQVSMMEENHEKIGELLDYSNQLLINQDENFFECDENNRHVEDNIDENILDHIAIKKTEEFEKKINKNNNFDLEAQQGVTQE